MLHSVNRLYISIYILLYISTYPLNSIYYLPCPVADIRTAISKIYVKEKIISAYILHLIYLNLPAPG